MLTDSGNRRWFMWNVRSVEACEKARSKKIRSPFLPMRNCVVVALIPAHDGSSTRLNGKFLLQAISSFCQISWRNCRISNASLFTSTSGLGIICSGTSLVKKCVGQLFLSFLISSGLTGILRHFIWALGHIKCACLLWRASDHASGI